jgi:DNA repair exonuclease SbcCD ATPase subunit
MRKILSISLLLIACVFTNSFGQLNVQLAISPNPSPYLSDWQERRETATMIITNSSTDQFFVKLHTRIYQGGFSDGALQAQTITEKMPVLFINPGVTVLDATEMIPYESMEFYGHVNEVVIRTGKLPANNYTICVQLLDAELNEPLTQDQCRQFFITDYQGPMLLLPENLSELKPESVSNIIFRWTPVVPQPFDPITYTVAVFEVLPGQSPDMAFQANYPILTKEAMNTNFTLWTPEFDYPQPGMQYIWSVRAIDSRGNPLGQNDGWAEPFIFNVTERSTGFGSDCSCESIKRTIEMRDCKSCYSIEVEGLPIDINCGVPIFLREVNSVVSAKSDFPADCGEHNWLLTGTVFQPNPEYLTTDVNASKYITRQIDIPLSNSNNAFFESFGWGKFELIHSVNGIVVSRFQFYSDEPPSDDVGLPITKGSHSIKIISPQDACVGSVVSEVVDGLVTITWESIGEFVDFDVVILENPCGRYRYPVPSKVPPVKVPAMSRVPYEGEIEGGGEGGVIKEVHKEKVTGRETRSDWSTTNSVVVPLAEVLDGGDAFIVQIEGNATSADGEVFLVYSEPICSRHRPLDSDGNPVETTPCFPPHRPENACMPSFKPLPGSEISLGVYVENIDLFEYPRAVAMTADAVDWDIVEVRCNPNDDCPETRSMEQFAVRDFISPNQYKWELIGKGSLNDPFDVGNIAQLTNEINDIIKKIAELKERIDSLNRAKDSRVSTLKIQQEMAKEQVGKTDTTIMMLKDSLITITQILTSKRDSLAIIINERISLSDRIISKRDSVDGVILDSISYYDELLLNKPSSYELGLYDKIADARDEVDDAHKDLRQSQTHLADETKRLQDEIIQASDAVKNQQDVVNNINTLIEGNQQRVIFFERQAYKLFGSFATVARNYMRERDQYRRSMSNFIIQNFDYGSDIHDTLSNIFQFSEMVAEDVIGSTNQQYRMTRLAIFDSLNVSFSVLSDDSCRAKSDSLRRVLCSSSLAFVASSYTLYRQALNSAITSNYVVDTSAIDSIKKYRNAILTYEPMLQAAKIQLQQTFDAYNQALENDSTTIAQILQTQKDLKDSITAREQRLAKVETELRDTVSNREEKFTNKRVEFVDRIAFHEEFRQMTIIDISRLSDTVQVKIADSTVCITEIIKIQSDSTIIERDIKIQEDLLKSLQDILKLDSNDIKKEIDDMISKLRNEIKALEDKLNALKDSLNVSFAGTKTATGPKVYYIPPPLEDIMKDKTRFEELKDSVAKAEADLLLAKAEKEAGQKKLARMLERIGRSLIQYVNAEEKISELEDAKKDAEDILDEEDEESKEYGEKLDGIRQTAESAKATSEQKLKDLDPDKIKNELVVINQDIVTKKIDVADALNDFNDSYLDLIDKSSNLGQYRKQLQELTKQYESTLDRANELKTALTQSQNEVARIRALNDYARAQDAKADLDKNEQAYKNQQDKIQLLVTAIQVLLQNHNSTTNQQSDAENEFMEKIGKVAEKMKELSKLFDNYFEKWNEYQAEKLQVAHWKVTKVKAEDLEGKVDDAENKLNQMKKTDSLQKQFDVTKVDDELRKYQDAKSNADSTIAKIVKEGKELLDTLEKRIEDAEKLVKEKKEDLRQFLLNEFNTVDLKVQLKVTVNDDVIDGFRYDDNEKILMKELKYMSKREPIFDSEKPDVSAPPVDKKAGECLVRYDFDEDPPIAASDPSFKQKEPRTIALVYKNGEPLWPEWPVIDNSAPTLSKDVVIMAGNAQDTDVLTVKCRTDCETKPIKDGIVELPKYIWRGDGKYYQINTANLEHQVLAYWEPPDVPQPFCQKDFEVINDFNSVRKGPDTDVIDKKTKPLITPGVLIEVPEKLIGWSEKKDSIKARIVKGDHTGLPGEKVEYSVTLLEGRSEDYGFPTDTVKVVTTDGDGYAPIEFNFGKGFAKFEIKVKWFRKDTCDIKTIEAESPLKIQMLRFASGLSKEALDGAMEIWDGASVQDIAATMSTEDEKRIYGIAGLFDNYPNFINEEYINYKLDDPKLAVDPDSVETSLFGIAVTYVDGDVPENAKLELTARCEEIFEPIADPYEDSMELNTTKSKRFKIGIDNSIFTVVMDEPFTVGEMVSGTGKLEIAPDPLNPAFLTQLLNIVLVADEVFVEYEGQDTVAQSGRVTWEAPDGLSADLPGFTFKLDSLSLRAKQAAQMGGKISSTSDKLPHPVGFDAELYTDGEFFGNVYNLPEINVSSFRLNQGTSLAIDWSSTRSVAGFDNKFKGIVIRTATLEFPNVFSRKNSPDKMALVVDNFGISQDGVQGTIALQGEVTGGFAGFEMTLEQIALEFEMGRLNPKTIKLEGNLTPPSNIIDGTIAFKITKSGDDWIGEMTTKGDILVPSIGLTIALNDGTKAEWNTVNEEGYLVVNGMLKSRFTGEIELENLKITSDGEIDADAVRVKTDAALVIRGFSLNLDEVALVRVSGEGSTSQYAIEVSGGFGFPSIPVQKIEGKLIVSPGLKIAVEVSDVEISFEYGPVEFSGKVKFGNNFFRGDFDVGLKQPKFGLKCSFIIGTQEIDSINYFTYWYAEMQLGLGATGIPLGSTGLAITRLGGGVGWNYDPPVGSQEGAPRKTDGFAFKALIGIGTVPGGKFLNSLFTMVYTPSKFSLGGKLWLLEQEDNIFAEGVLNLYFNSQSPNAIDGFVKSFVGIPDAEGKIVRLDGKINYKITRGGNINIESETLNGAILDLLKAEGTIKINENVVDLNGRIFLEFYSDDISLAGVLTLIVDFKAEASGSFKYMVKQTRLFAGVKFEGHIDINLDTPFGVADILSAQANVNMRLDARPSRIEASGFAYFAYSAWIYSGNARVDFGFTI